MEAELDLSGRSPRGDMLKSGLEGENEARAFSVENCKRREALVMYIQLPDYGDFQGYDLWIEAVLSRIARGIYAYFHKP